ncbi:MULTISPECIES: hypothetical protein [Rhizobium]|uniref:hypothetical protein n=1 Tax=Rhizobium TaxID=379 RepID=UPI0026CC69AD
MDNTPQMPQNITFPSRYFWRRFAAYIVDVTIFQAAILIAVYYFSATSPWTSFSTVGHPRSAPRRSPISLQNELKLDGR